MEKKSNTVQYLFIYTQHFNSTVYFDSVKHQLIYVPKSTQLGKREREYAVQEKKKGRSS